MFIFFFFLNLRLSVFDIYFVDNETIVFRVRFQVSGQVQEVLHFGVIF